MTACLQLETASNNFRAKNSLVIHNVGFTGRTLPRHSGDAMLDQLWCTSNAGNAGIVMDGVTRAPDNCFALTFSFFSWEWRIVFLCDRYKTSVRITIRWSGVPSGKGLTPPWDQWSHKCATTLFPFLSNWAPNATKHSAHAASCTFSVRPWNHSHWANYSSPKKKLSRSKVRG